MLRDNIWLLFALLLFIIYLFKKNTITEDFFLWNLATRWPKLPYDLRGNPYYYLHNGNVFSSNYVNLISYPDVQYYLPYYHNGMIYSANGQYRPDTFAQLYPTVPIIYPTYDAPVDWLSLERNGLISSKKIESKSI
jgi:hypothetical protein